MSGASWVGDVGEFHLCGGGAPFEYKGVGGSALDVNENLVGFSAGVVKFEGGVRKFRTRHIFGSGVRFLVYTTR